MAVRGPESPENIALVRAEFQFQGYIAATEHRAITLPQLRRIVEFVRRNCGRWRDLASPQQSMTSGHVLGITWLNLYHIAAWLIGPATVTENCSFVELLTEFAQMPAWFVSHWWGERTVDFLQCLEMHACTRHLSINSAYWVCAYANRQHCLTDDVAMNPKESSFYKALHIAKGLLLVLDAATGSSGPATPFSRIWCGFEQSVALDDPDRDERMLLDIATCIGNESQLITDGIASADESHIFPSKAKVIRESKFPLEIFRVGLSTSLEMGQASNEEDRVHILNCLAGRGLNQSPLQKHENYTRVNNKLRAVFAVAVWRLAVEKGMVAAMQLPDRLAANTGMKSIALDFTGCQSLDHTNLLALTNAFPSGLERCHLMFRECRHIGDGNAAILADGIPDSLSSFWANFNECVRLGDAGLAAISACLPSGLQSLNLSFWGCSRISDRGVAALAQGVPKGLHDLTLNFHCTGLTDGGVSALARCLPNHLKHFKLFCSMCDQVGDAGAASIARCLPHSVEELELRFEGCTKLGDAGVAALVQRLMQDRMQVTLKLAGSSVTEKMRALADDWEALRAWYKLEVVWIAEADEGWIEPSAAAIAVQDDASPEEMEGASTEDVGPRSLKRSASGDFCLDVTKMSRGSRLLSQLKRCATAPF